MMEGSDPGRLVSFVKKAYGQSEEELIPQVGA